MRPDRRLIGVLAALGVTGAACLAALYLALHDIFGDYVSRRVLGAVGLDTEPLPAWSACPGEWRVVAIAFWLLVSLHIAFFVVLALLARRSPTGT